MIGRTTPVQPAEWWTYPITPEVLATAGAVLTADIELLQQEPRQVLLGIAMSLEESWAAPGLASLEISVGTTLVPDLYAAGWDVGGTVRAADSFQVATMFGMQSLETREPVVIRATADVNLDEFTAGRMMVSCLLGRVP